MITYHCLWLLMISQDHLSHNFFCDAASKFWWCGMWCGSTVESTESQRQKTCSNRDTLFWQKARHFLLRTDHFESRKPLGRHLHWQIVLLGQRRLPPFALTLASARGIGASKRGNIEASREKGWGFSPPTFAKRRSVEASNGRNV